jgi:hypothetical protein
MRLRVTPIRLGICVCEQVLECCRLALSNVIGLCLPDVAKGSPPATFLSKLSNKPLAVLSSRGDDVI